MLYPANMQTHGPRRSLEEYLDYLYEQLGREPIHTPRALDLTARIRGIEDEIAARGSL
jgi:hypothetical protein